jgi:signal transduction histidine kinase/CheY-like chemotaxis protein/purine-cytosine permease-like protein
MRATQQIFRVRREYNQWVANQTLEDYALRFTAKHARRWTAWEVCMTALGATAFMALEAIGGSITLSYGFTNALAAILMVSLVIFVTGWPISYFAAKHGVDIDLLTRGAGFGYLGSTVTSLIYASFTFIFFAIEAAILAMALKALFGIPLPVGYVICAVAVVPIVTHGITAISRFQVGSQGIWLFLQITALVAVLWFEWSNIAAWQAFEGAAAGATPGFDIALFGAASAVMFALVAQIGEQVDYLRFLPDRTRISARQWWPALVLAGPGWILIGMVKLLAGSFMAWLAFSRGASIETATDPTHMYQAAFGYIAHSPALALALAGVLVIISQMKINVTNAYAGSIAWSNFFSRVTHSHPGRVVWLVFNVIIALLLMELGIYQALENTLGLFAIIAVSWLGTIAADLMISRTLGLRPRELEFKRAHLYDINPVGIGSMMIATTVGLICYFGVLGDIPQALAHYATLLTTFVMAPLLAWYTGGRYYLAREPVLAASTEELECCICENHFETEDMAVCPAYGGNICSLCCSLDGRCLDSCKDNARFTEQINTWLQQRLPAALATRIDSRLASYLFILGVITVLNGTLFYTVYYYVTPAEANATTALLSRTLWILFFTSTVITGVLAWAFLLIRESQVVAQEESIRQNTLLTEEIEAHRATDHELQLAMETAEAANDAKSRYLAGISHELRTPLQSILGYAQLLSRDESIPVARRESINIVRRSGEYLSDLIEGLLDISRIEAGKLEVQSQQVDLHALLDELSDMFNMLARDRSIQFNAEISGDIPRYVRTDEKRLRQVLINLLSNAVKFTDTGEVTFRVNYRSQVARFEVEDTGIGMQESDLERIFLPFEQVHTTTRRNGPGTGLGLTIVKLLVELLGGDIAVHSVPGEGTRMAVALMLSSVLEPEPGALPRKRILGYTGRKQHVMVVDDDPLHRSLMQDLLTPLGFDVKPAIGAAECLQFIEQYDADIFLIDVSMPGMNGIELAAALDNRGIHTPILMISADARERHSNLKEAIPPDQFMVKPIKLTDLLQRIGALLDIEWLYQKLQTEESNAAYSDADELEIPALPEFTKLRAYAEIGYLKGVKNQLDELRTEPRVPPELMRRLDYLADKALLESMAQLFEDRS